MTKLKLRNLILQHAEACASRYYARIWKPKWRCEKQQERVENLLRQIDEALDNLENHGAFNMHNKK